MKYYVRLYTNNDYEEIRRWYSTTDEGIPSPHIFPQDSTLILEQDGTPVFCIAIYLTNCKEICYLEGFIANPDFTKSDRLEASYLMRDAACSFAKGLGYKNAMTFSYRDKVKERIEALGFTKTLDNLSCFVKEL